MDALLLKLFIICTLIVFGVLSEKSTSPVAVLETNNGDTKCTTKYRNPEIYLEGRRIGGQGPKGDKGDRGPPGKPGDVGEDGPMGYPGRKGATGPSGVNGEKGVKGRQGSLGAPGNVGPMGSQGPSGTSGRCNSKIFVAEEDYSKEQVAILSSSSEFGTAEKPITVTCKWAKNIAKDFREGAYYMGPLQRTFQVICNLTTQETCVTGKITDKINFTKILEGPEEFVYRNESFWVSQSGFDLNTLYNLTYEQLVWLQRRSVSVRQTFKFHSRNSIIYSSTNESLSIQLLTFNEVVIGPRATENMPFFYNVKATTDYVEGSDAYQSTVIELHSTNVNRLPIIDVRINDIRDELQEFYIENTEICFV